VVPVALEAAAGSPPGRFPAAVPSFIYIRACAVASLRKCVLLLLSCVLFIVLPVVMASVCHAWSEALTPVLRAVDPSTPLCNRWLNVPALRTGFSESVVMHTVTSIRRLAPRFRGGSLHCDLSDLRARQHSKTRNDAHGEWRYVAEKDCPTTEDTGSGRPVPPFPPPPTRVAPGTHAQKKSGVLRAHEDPRVIVSAGRILLRRLFSVL